MSTTVLLFSSYFNLSDLYIIITFTSLDFWAGVSIFNMQCKFILPLSCLFFIFRAMVYSEQKAWLWDNVLSVVLFLLSNLMDPIITTLKKSVRILGFDVWVFISNPHTIPLKILPINFVMLQPNTFSHFLQTTTHLVPAVHVLAMVLESNFLHRYHL